MLSALVSSQGPKLLGGSPLLPADQGEPEKRRAILHAAVRVFAEKGYEGCRIADIAKRAGVAYGLVYHYFRSKEELLEQVLAEQWSVFIDALERIVAGPAAAPDQLAAMCDFAVDVFRKSPDVVRVVLLEVARTPNALRSGSTRQAFEDAVNIIAGVIRRGQERGEIRESADPMITAAGVLGAMEMSLTGLVLGVVGASSDEDVERVKRSIVDLMLAGVSAR
jgi:TetR/AcrR family fatty acid metabolism transcriptional regulator